MTSPDREPPFSRTYAICSNSKERLDIEHKVLSEASKQSFARGDSTGVALAHKGLCVIIQQQLFSGDASSTGSVIPASFWQQLTPQEPEPAPAAPAPAPASNGGSEVHAPAAQTREPSEAQQAAQALADMSAAAAQDLQDAAAGAETLGLSPDSQIPEGGPISYLDFGDEADDQPSTGDEVPPPSAEVADTSGIPALQPEPPPRLPSQLIRTQTFYQVLGVNNLSSFEEIHLKFLRIMRRLLRNRAEVTDMREFREVLRAICVAHDILKDPHTRTDYDLRQMGMRTSNGQGTEPTVEVKTPPRIRLMIGELLECAKILEPTELEIALDMHKAEPGLQFGEFLVRAGFLNREELDSAILAQRLISSGKITVAQFQTAMWKMRDEGTSFFDTLMIEGWLSPSDIFDENSDLWETPMPANGTDSAPNMVTAAAALKLADSIQAAAAATAANAVNASLPAPPDRLSGEHARPQWANDLDWGDSVDDAGSESASQVNADSYDGDRSTIGGSSASVTEAIAAMAQHKDIMSDDDSDENSHDGLIAVDPNAEAALKHVDSVVEAATLAARGAKGPFADTWTEKDTMAETQSLDIKALRAVLEAEVKDSD